MFAPRAQHTSRSLPCSHCVFGLRVREPGAYDRDLALADQARQRAFARAGRVRFDVAARRALDGQQPWYRRWYRRPGGPEPFADAVGRQLREDAEYTRAVEAMA